MFSDPSKYEFSPGDIASFVKWLGWTASPDHMNNDSDLLERETWYWVSPKAQDALDQSVWNVKDWDEAPILLPEDLPSPDGVMVLGNPMVLNASDSSPATQSSDVPSDVTFALESFIGVRWTSKSDFLVVQSMHGKSMRAIFKAQGSPTDDPDFTFVPDPTKALRPDSWREFDRTSDSSSDFAKLLRYVPINCSDGSPLCLLFTGTQIWQWGRRSTPQREPYHALPKEDDIQFRTTPHEYLPLLSPVPPIPFFVEPTPPEYVDLPYEDHIRELVAAPPLYCDAGEAVFARLLHCLWAYAAQPLPPSTPRKIMRDIPKVRRHPDEGKTGGIRVVTLREVGDFSSEDDPTGRRRPRRHLVRGHWRRHWHPKLQTHRIRWIAPHLRAGRPSDPPMANETRTVRSVHAPEVES